MTDGSAVIKVESLFCVIQFIIQVTLCLFVLLIPNEA